MPRVFGHGGLRLVLLSLLEDGPRHGYELIVALEDRFMGMYRPSTGTVYPRLAALEEEGLISSEEIDGKRVYQLTDSGRAELTRRRSEVEDTVTTATSAAWSLVDDLQADIRAAVSAVQTEVRRQTSATGEARQAVEDVRRAARDAAREARRVSEEARRVAMEEAARIRHITRDEAARIRAAARDEAARVRYTAEAPTDRVRADIDDLVSEVSSWASEAVDDLRRLLPDDDQRARLRDALNEARRAFLDTMHGHDSDASA
jgi:DNA-binding PadR family transcriptional regulator